MTVGTICPSKDSFLETIKDKTKQYKEMGHTSFLRPQRYLLYIGRKALGKLSQPRIRATVRKLGFSLIIIFTS